MTEQCGGVSLFWLSTLLLPMLSAIGRAVAAAAAGCAWRWSIGRFVRWGREAERGAEKRCVDDDDGHDDDDERCLRPFDD